SRPSASTTTIRSSVTDTSTAVASSLTAEMVIPCLEKCRAMFNHQGLKPIDLVGAESVGLREAHWLQPELGHAVAVLNMDVRRLRSFQTVEKEAISGRSQGRSASTHSSG